MLYPSIFNKIVGGRSPG